MTTKSESHANEFSTAAAPRPGVGDRSDTRVHISLDVRDVEASVKFYEAFLGAKAHKVRKGYANFDLVEPPLKLAFNERRNVEPTDSQEGVQASRDADLNHLSHLSHLSHLGFQVATTEQVLAARRRLVEAGLWTLEETGVCCHAQQDKVWVKDPDGVSWEIYAVTDDLLEVDKDADHPVADDKRAKSPMTACCTAVDTAKCC